MTRSEVKAKLVFCNSTLLHAMLVKIDPKVEKRRGGNKVLS